jgi:hypothetical protein
MRQKWRYNILITPFVILCAPLTLSLLWLIVPATRALADACRWAYEHMPRWKP